jgi:tetratricopeptide (TPR) repeat protein
MRFDKLEFGDSPGRQPAHDAQRGQTRDETHWLGLADQNRRCGHYENSLRYYSRALELDKSIIPAWVGQVQMLVHLGEYPQAELWSVKALELFPSHGDLLAAQAQAQCRMGDMKKAHALSDGALRQRGQSAFRWLVRGEVMVANKQETDRHCFDKACEDRDWLISLEAALIYSFYRFPSKALLRAKTAVESAPDAYYAWYVQGLSQLEVGFDSAAQASFQRCLELCPRHADAQRQLAEMQRGGWPLLRALRRVIRRS